MERLPNLPRPQGPLRLPEGSPHPHTTCSPAGPPAASRAVELCPGDHSVRLKGEEGAV